jgi:hypothetical protein
MKPIMSIREILEQAKRLTPQEQDELLEQLQAMRDTSQSREPVEPGEHWGKNLLRLLDDIGPIDLIHPEIEVPVE